MFVDLMITIVIISLLEIHCTENRSYKYSFVRHVSTKYRHAENWSTLMNIMKTD